MPQVFLENAGREEWSTYDGYGFLWSGRACFWLCPATRAWEGCWATWWGIFSRLPSWPWCRSSGYRLIYKDIGEKEITYIFAAAWAYLVIAQLFKL